MLQGSEEWHEFRRRGIGASDAPVIMGTVKWKSKKQLLEEKRGAADSQKKNAFMQRGLDLEEPARLEFERLTCLTVSPCIVISKERPWQFASMDGMTFEHDVMVEIKCPGPRDHQVAVEGDIPEKYIPQLQHQLCVTELDWGYYFSFDGNRGILIKFLRDQKYIDELIEKETEFYNSMCETIFLNS